MIPERRPLVSGAALVMPAIFWPALVTTALAALIAPSIITRPIAVRPIIMRPIAVRFEWAPALRLSPSILLAIPIERRPASLRFRPAGRGFRLRVKIPALALLEARTLLVARELVPRARILVRAAWPPVRVAARRLSSALDERDLRGLRRLPQLAAIEPAQRDVLLRALKLVQRRQQVLAARRSKRRRHGAGQDHPEGLVPRHINISVPLLSAARGAEVFR
jgi:hypothetical protein